MRFSVVILSTATLAAGCSDQANGKATNTLPSAAVIPPPVAPAPTLTTTPESPSPKPRAGAPLVIPALEAPFERSTLSGVYTAADAREGRDLYLGYCVSCHSASTHTGPEFRAKWAGRPLADLFNYMRTNMPKNDPASLDDSQYAVLLAYILQMNKMPAGKAALSPDPDDLAKIRLDTIPTRRP